MIVVVVLFVVTVDVVVVLAFVDVVDKNNKNLAFCESKIAVLALVIAVTVVRNRPLSTKVDSEFLTPTAGAATPPETS